MNSHRWNHLFPSNLKFIKKEIRFMDIATGGWRKEIGSQMAHGASY